MSVIEEVFEASAEVVAEAAALAVGPAAELAADVAVIGVDAVVEGVETAGELVEAAIDEGGSILVKLLIVAGLVAIAVFVWKRMNTPDEYEAPDARTVG